MFGWFNDTDSSHERAIEQDIMEAELDPTERIAFADHTDRRPDPPKINGRVPDEVRVNTVTGERTVVEKESHPESSRSKRQVSDLRAGTNNDVVVEPLWEDDDLFDF